MENLASKQELVAALRKKEAIDRRVRFDGEVPDSRPSERQEEILRKWGSDWVYLWLVAANQTGKTAIGARLYSWMFEENHPHWKRPADWGDTPLQLLVFARTLKIFEDVIWRKISANIDPACYRLVRNSSGIEKIVHTGNGNEIIVFSHHNTGDAQEKAQGFVAHAAWIDEMPHSARFVEEVLRRLSSKQGYYLATFTPKVRNDEIRRTVDAIEQRPNGISHVARLHMFRDNPLYRDSPTRQAAVLESLAGMPESVKRTVLYGDWGSPEGSVWSVDYDRMVKPRPAKYSPSWRHVEVVDPATQSKLGYLLFAENPDTNYWHIVKAEYVEGVFVPSMIVEACHRKSRDYNVVKRISDPSATWFMNEARAVGLTYCGVYNKNNRKMDLLAKAQERVGKDVFIDPSAADGIMDELTSMEWSETTEGKIVNSHKYHIYDCLVYGIDGLPRPEIERKAAPFTFDTYHQYLRDYDDKVKTSEHRKAQISRAGRIRPRYR